MPESWDETERQKLSKIQLSVKPVWTVPLSQKPNACLTGFTAPFLRPMGSLTKTAALKLASLNIIL